MRLRRAWLCGLACALLLGACANQPPMPRNNPLADGHWQGRLAIKVFTKPVQALSASFELNGNPEHGELLLTSPLGTTLARMQWAAGSATLSTHDENRHYESLQDLATAVTGTDVPVTALFAWLQGEQAKAPGWQADLRELDAGRITALHEEEVRAELKIILTP